MESSKSLSPEQNVVPLENPNVIYGHRTCQTRDVKWLCLENIYQKLHRPNFYDIGGTYVENVADYWFSYKTEQVGHIFLLHLFVSNHVDDSSFCIAVSNGSDLKIDKKSDIAYLPEFYKECYLKHVKSLTPKYLNTYSFSDMDLEYLKTRRLYIGIQFPLLRTDDVSQEIIDNIKANHDCGALLSDPICSDFIIESSDGVKFNVHKVLLVAHSEVFKAMLKGETAESQNGYVKLVDVGDKDLHSMLEYIYTGTVKDVENINFVNLLMLADRYDLKGLWNLCENALSQQVSVENALETLIVADMHDSHMLKNAALKFIKKNASLLEAGTLKDINNSDLLLQLYSAILSK